MLGDSEAFSGFSVDDINEAERFYGEALGIEAVKTDMGLELRLAGGNTVFVYEKADHEPASFTILNFPVEDIDATIDTLVKNGVEFERYDDLPAEQDERGVLRGRAAGMGPDIAWFRDPAGNVLSVLSE